MAHYAVKYQLNNQKDYKPLWDEMARLKAHKAMRSLYLLDSGSTAKQLRVHFAKFIDGDDMLLVTPLVERPESHKCFQGTAAWIDVRF